MSSGGRQRERLRIVIVIKTNDGGAWILPQIAEMNRRGHHVSVILPAGNGRLRRALDGRGVPVFESPFDFSYRPRLSLSLDFLRLRRLIRDLQPDVVQYHLLASAIAARIATIRLGVRRVHMVAGPLYLESSIVRAAERILGKLDDIVIGGSEYTAARYKTLAGRNTSVRAIAYGVDTEWFTPASSDQRSRQRQALGLEPSDVLVVMVAYVYAPKRFVHRGHGIKGHEVLLEAWRQVRGDNPNAHLLILGGGFGTAGEQHRQELLQRFGLPSPHGGVRWLDTVDDVRPIYAAADLSVCPSLSENHGAALEATACGIPCIVSDAGALPETVRQSSGWIVKAGDATDLARVLREAVNLQPACLRDRGNRARIRTVDLFDSRATAAAVLDVLELVSVRAATQRQRPVTMFSEARTVALFNGDVLSEDPNMVHDHWKRGLDQVQGLRIATRCRRAANADGERMSGEVVALPYYVGFHGLVHKLPSVIWAVDRLVCGSRAVIVRLPGPIGLLAVMSAVCRRRPIVAELVGDVEEVLAIGTGGRLGRIFGWIPVTLTQWSMRRAAATRYVTQTVLQTRYPPSQDTPSMGFSNVTPDHSPTNGVVPGLEDERIITIGSLEQLYKGHDVLLRALAQLASTRPRAHLIIIGDGRCRPMLQDLAGSLGVSERVDFCGNIGDRELVSAALDSASVFALASRTEGLPRALVEAMARGLPCVASRVGGVTELLQPEFIVDVDDVEAFAHRLDLILGDRKLRIEQGVRNRQCSLNYSASALAHQSEEWAQQVFAITNADLEHQGSE